MNKQAIIVGALWVLGLAYFIFWACAPTTAVGPMAPRNGAEVGGGLTVLVNPPDGQLLGFVSPELPVAIDGQGWFEHREGIFSIGIIGFFGQTSIIGVGFFTRLTFVDNDNISFGAELQAGGLWAALAFPTSFRLNDGARLTLNPSFGLRGIAVQVPIGVALDAGDNNIISLSASMETPYPTGDGDDEWFLEPPTKLRLGLGYGRTLE